MSLEKQYGEIDWSFVYPNNSYVELSMKDFKVLKALAERELSTKWAVFIGIAPKFESYEPLAFGRGDESEKHMLLRRNRIELFDSEAAAGDALKATCAIGRANNSPWMNWRFKIVEAVLWREQESEAER